MRRQVESGSNALTLKLAGTFTPNQELYELAEYAGTLNVRLFDRTAAAGVLRPDVTVSDLGLLLEQVAAISFGATAARNVTLRLRCMELLLDGMRTEAARGGCPARPSPTRSSPPGGCPRTCDGIRWAGRPA